MTGKRVLIIAIFLIVIAAGIGGYFKFFKTEEGGLQVQTGPAERMTIVETVTATGRIQPETQVNISADVSGKIIRLEVKEGDRIEQGQLLLELDRERHSAAVESSEANLRMAQSNSRVTLENLTKTEKDLVRIRELFHQDLETQAQLDAAEAAYQAEKARYQSTLDQVEQVRASLKQSTDDLSKTRIYSPMAGTISVLNKEVGEIAVGSQFQSDVIMVLSNLSGMEALVDVDENDIVSVSLADEATIEVDALPDTEARGVVTEIASSAKISGQGTSDQRTEFEVKITVIDPVTELRPGMTCSCDVVTETRENALGVPIQCVAVRTLEQLEAASSGAGGETSGTDGTGWTPDKDGFVEIVWVVSDGRAWARQVKTGIQSDTHIEILAGLEEGDEVITGSYRAISRDLHHGAEVVLSDPDAPAGEEPT
jgi:HlyD family secretion protein